MEKSTSATCFCEYGKIFCEYGKYIQANDCNLCTLKYKKVRVQITLNDFNKTTQIPLDPIYVGKMIFAIFALVKKGYFAPNTKILAIHTGGLQGIEGFNKERIKKQKIILNYEEKI